MSLAPDERAVLRARISELETEVESLREIIVGSAPIVDPAGVYLTQQESTMFRVLVSRPVATKDALSAVFYGGRVDKWPNPKIFDIIICRLRKKFQHTAIRIDTIWGRGWQLDDASRRLFRDQMTVSVEEAGRH